eukprot:10386275-Ditylum_brightwellii.AAC.1
MKQISPQLHVLCDAFFSAFKIDVDSTDPILTDIDRDYLIHTLAIGYNFDPPEFHLLPPAHLEWNISAFVSSPLS